MLALQQPGLFSLSAAFLSLFLFYLLYVWWYGRETFWQVNRLYLLLAPLLAFAIPHIRITVAPEVVPPGTISPDLLLLLQQWQAGNALPSPEAGPRIGEIVLATYLTGVAIALLRLLLRSYRVLCLIQKGDQCDLGNCTLVVHQEFHEPASFFRYIFSSSAEALPEMVMQHELVHVKQRHTLDVLLMECWVALHWYNPLIYRFRDRLRATHEFIADSAVVEQHQQGAYAYARLLITQPLNQSDMLYNTFAAQISSRLRMLARRPSASWRLAAHSLSVPLVMALFLFFSVQIAKSAPVLAIAQQMKVLEAREGFPLSSLPPLHGLTAWKEGETTAVTDTFPKKEKVVVVVGHPLQDTLPVKEKVMIVTGHPLSKDPITGQPLKMDTLRLESDMSPQNTMADALFVIDGVIQNQPANQALESVKPEDIKSINVLKGESATKLYGERGKNGVIEIFTKNGNASSPSGQKSRTVTFSSSPSTPGETQVVEMNVETRYGQDDLPIGKSSTTIRVLANGELVGEVKNVRKKQYFEADQITNEEIQEIRIEGPKNKVYPQKDGQPSEIRTITLHFSDRQRAEEVLKSLKKGKKG